MKNIFKSLLVSLVIMLGMLISVSAQTSPPDMPGGHGATDDQPPGGGAPIASGLAILIGLGGAYAGKKIYQLKS